MFSTYNEGADSPYVGYGVFSYEKMFRELDEALVRQATGSWATASRSPIST